jgi:quercetin dioxygenase-like cupin family protein
MALPHAKPGDVIDIKPLGPALSKSQSHALFKSADLEVIRLVLLGGTVMPDHAVAGEITLQCLEGRIEFNCDAGLRELAAGQLIHVRADEVHRLRALEDTSLLLTIALRRSSMLQSH